MRSFVAIDLDEAIRESLNKLSIKLRALGGEVRWVNPWGIHLTLNFLGEVAEERIPKVEATLQAAAAGRKAFSLVVRGTGVFPPGARSPRVLWVGIEAPQDLSLLQGALEAGLAKLGFPAEKREYHPHLTLGRVKSPAGLKEVLAELEKEKEAVFGRMEAREIVLFQSLLSPSGAEYKPISRFKLE